MAVTPGTVGSVSASYVMLTPVDPSTIPSGALALDATNGDSFTIKDTGGSISEVTPPAQSDSLFTKVMQNLSGVSLPVNSAVAKKPDGSIIRADSDGVGTKVIIGITLAVISDGDTGPVMLLGPNAVGVISGLGFAPGDAIYVSPSSGFTNNTADFTLDDDITNDAIIRVGYADCPAGNASGAATDLILFAGVEAIG